MKRLLILMLLFLTACSSQGPASFFDRTPAPFDLSLESTPEEIQKAMLESAAHWTTLQMSGTITFYVPDSPAQVFTEKVWLDPLNSRYRVELTDATNNAKPALKLSDGETITNVNYAANTVEQFPYPDFARVGQYVPPLQEGAVYPNPIWGQIGTPLSEMAFPANFAQGKGTFTPLAVESVAGRNALVVSWTFSGNTSPSWKIWLDAQTAVILKMQEFGKEGGESLQAERVVESIAFDQTFDETAFALPADLPQVVAPTPGGIQPCRHRISPNVRGRGGRTLFLPPAAPAGSIY
ncbi:MAG: hypothetical protein HND47_08530 [Chloroflexi bacterium]|nr:hypothetical protein [Chloroflexota bacterium]